MRSAEGYVCRAFCLRLLLSFRSPLLHSHKRRQCWRRVAPPTACSSAVNRCCELVKTEAPSTQCTRLRPLFERALADTALAAWGHYYIALAAYRIADYLLAAGEENKGAASEHLKATVEHLKEGY